MRIFAALLLIASSAAYASIACGLPPLPPLGCVLGPCVCDSDGKDCHYEMICR
jgi:hypothetical protein